MGWLRDAVFHRLVVPCRELTLKRLMIALSAGTIGGVFPVPMLTSVATLIICRVLQCSTLEATLATSVNLLLTPLELFLVVPFASVTASVVGIDTNQFTAAALYQSTELGFTHFMRNSATLLIYSCICWMGFGFPLLYIIHSLQSRWGDAKDA
ncbi:hypothetical protein TraAM80_02149 [Trypanosoma rangeli]|uniref:DUF2062 domain-containing protein n=1 Tax=Trypanosoma rangeli TaxID=5698 RepID=A0A3R7KTL0_TRYRA|nr:uncharacterized protein TraAM80_02149 [Trypanosoma rangeli]RNF09439.1 hypothetical protein TraAM80_02149 [Trypanosoma rangeli]|eukprot:RNF09439.1 hypothetical protein TraAM80_02149 [Trypanosoma rangeli]